MSGADSGRLAWRIERTGACAVVAFAGDLDERAQLDSLGGALAGEVVFDMDGVRRINSAGVHHWVNFARELAAVTRLAFVRCRPNLVNQLNLIYGFAGPGRVASLYVPYLCEPCGEETLELMDAWQLRGSAAPRIACPRCAAPMDIDEDPARYLAFLDPAAR